MAWQKDTQASQTGSVRVGTTAHWKIIKQTIKDGRRPPPNDLWQLIMYEKEPQSSQKCLAQSYTTAETKNAMMLAIVGWVARKSPPLYSRFFLY